MLLLLSHLSRVRLCVTPETAAHQAPPSLGFSRQEHWSGLHFLLQCMKVKSESEVTQSCPTLRDPMNCSPPGSSVHVIFQAGVLEWGAIAFSFSFARFCQTAFQSGWTNWRCHQQCVKVPVASDPYQHLLLSLFPFETLPLMDVKQYYIMGFVWIVLVVNEAESFLMPTGHFCTLFYALLIDHIWTSNRI